MWRTNSNHRRNRARSRGTPLTLERLEGRTVPSGLAIGPLVQVSSLSPFADSTEDAFLGPPRAVHKEAEAWIDVNPTNPKNLLGVWRQDQGAGAPVFTSSRGLVAGVSLDGGATWQSVVIPGLSLVSGGTFYSATDPWVSFGPDGTAYVVSLQINTSDPTDASEVAVSRSTDGGLSWSAPAAVQHDDPGLFFNDKTQITADPTDPSLVYATWTRANIFPDFSGFTAPIAFARSTDGGRTWEPPQILSAPHRQATGAQIVVRPDGTLIATYMQSTDLSLADLLDKELTLAVAQSTDHGHTWTVLQERAAVIDSLDVIDAETGQQVIAGQSLPDVALDPRTGRLYAVWMDGRFSGGAYNDIALAMSDDGGRTWTAPVRVNQTPTDIPAADRQASYPSVAVAADGTVAVTYADFRFNTVARGLPTDY